jgi:hypothetical protein
VAEIVAGTEEVDDDDDEDEEELLRLATISPVLSKKTPIPDSQQVGLSSQQ